MWWGLRFAINLPLPSSGRVVLEHPIGSHLLVRGAGASSIGVGVDGDTTTGREDSCNLNVPRIHELHEVIQNQIRTIFVESTVISETKEVQLKTLTLHHANIWNVRDDNLCKIGLVGDGTEAGKLGATEGDPIVSIGVGVFKCLKHFGGIGGGIDGFTTQ